MGEQRGGFQLYRYHLSIPILMSIRSCVKLLSRQRLIGMVWSLGGHLESHSFAPVGEGMSHLTIAIEHAQPPAAWKPALIRALSEVEASARAERKGA